MKPTTIIIGALLSQLLLALIMFGGACIMQASRSRTARFKGEPLYSGFSWLILILLLISITALVITQSLSSFWIELFRSSTFVGIPDQWATFTVFFVNVVITTMLVANTGGSVNSPFQPIFFVIPTLALLLFESTGRVLFYAAASSLLFIFLLARSEPLHDSQRRAARLAYGFVSISCLGLAVFIGLLTRTCPDTLCG